jgi:hypothetical protein
MLRLSLPLFLTPQVDYLEYLSSLAAFESIPKQERLKRPYRCVCGKVDSASI